MATVKTARKVKSYDRVINDVLEIQKNLSIGLYLIEGGQKGL